MERAKIHERISGNRLRTENYEKNFCDAHPPLNLHEAKVEADRCYFCYDAPCVTACPTSIDIPKFIRQISTGDIDGSAKTIFDQNILGGMCARVCPTETLCEEACVRETAESDPVKIGLLQRHATDKAIFSKQQFYKREAETGKKIAVIGAGPAGLACAHRLSMYGHTVSIYDAREKPGGLNEYGIAAYKTVDNFAQNELDFIREIGGIEFHQNKKLGKDLSLENLMSEYDCIFLGVGLEDTNNLSFLEEKTPGVEDAVDYIANLRQTADKSTLPVGRKVVVIGGGMTAVDISVQIKLLGAEEVTIAYRRGKEAMNASSVEKERATSNGIVIREWLQPSSIEKIDSNLSAVKFEYTAYKDKKLIGTNEFLTLEADQLFLAIGQTLEDDPLLKKLKIDNGKIWVDSEGRTSIPKVWAGGDCTIGGEDLTVTAVANGRDSAESINNFLRN